VFHDIDTAAIPLMVNLSGAVLLPRTVWKRGEVLLEMLEKVDSFSA